MKLFYWLPVSEEDHHGRRDGHYLWMNCSHFAILEVNMMIGGVVFQTLHPFRMFRAFAKNQGVEYELSAWIFHLYLPKVRDGCMTRQTAGGGGMRCVR